jgi:hypothetical protein
MTEAKNVPSLVCNVFNNHLNNPDEYCPISSVLWDFHNRKIDGQYFDLIYPKMTVIKNLHFYENYLEQLPEKVKIKYFGGLGESLCYDSTTVHIILCFKNLSFEILNIEIVCVLADGEISQMFNSLDEFEVILRNRTFNLQ